MSAGTCDTTTVEHELSDRCENPRPTPERPLMGFPWKLP